MADLPLLDARAAAALLGVAPATLYAYVSRGLLHAEPGPDGRRKLYRRAELMALRQRKGRAPEGAAGALDFGMPVLESALTQIADGRLYYRGREATVLAETARLEEVAALLWGSPVGGDPGGRQPALPRLPAAPPLARAIAGLALGEEVAFGARRAEGGMRLVRRLAALLLDAPISNRPIGDQVAAAWALDGNGRQLVEAALILAADHELNASAFAARVAASTGASLSAAVIAGLAALSGPRHGGETARVAALFDEIAKPARAETALAARLGRDERLPGFGHPLYPGGDPRARCLLDLLHAHRPSRRLALADAVGAAGWRLAAARPNIDFALVATARALDLPDAAPLTLFALGRSIGWIAHILEQQTRPELIRPRARYVGPPAGSAIRRDAATFGLGRP